VYVTYHSLTLVPWPEPDLIVLRVLDNCQIPLHGHCLDRPGRTRPDRPRTCQRSGSSTKSGWARLVEFEHKLTTNVALTRILWSIFLVILEISLHHCPSPRRSTHLCGNWRGRFLISPEFREIGTGSPQWVFFATELFSAQRDGCDLLATPNAHSTSFAALEHHYTGCRENYWPNPVEFPNGVQQCCESSMTVELLCTLPSFEHDDYYSL